MTQQHYDDDDEHDGHDKLKIDDHDDDQVIDFQYDEYLFRQLLFDEFDIEVIDEQIFLRHDDDELEENDEL